MRRATIIAVPGNHRCDLRRGRPRLRTGVEAYFTARSYRPGANARLVVLGSVPVRAQIFRAGPERAQTWAHDVMNGVPAAAPFTITHRTTAAPAGGYAGGLYFVRLEATSTAGSDLRPSWSVRAASASTASRSSCRPTRGPRTTYAAGESGTQTRDSTTSSSRVRSITVGPPPHFVDYDVGFVRWLAHTSRGGLPHGRRPRRHPKRRREARTRI